MTGILRTVAAAACFAMSSGSIAHAAVVAEGGTGSAGAGGFSVESGTPIFDVSGPYSAEISDPASGWVWTSNAALDAVETFLFTFDLTGFLPSTAVVEGKWGVDNYGTLALNGNVISVLPPSGLQSNFLSLTAFATSEDSLFIAGTNTLSFAVNNNGGPAAFRASVRVTADPVVSPPGDPSGVVPLPGTLPLMLGAFALLAGRARWFRR